MQIHTCPNVGTQVTRDETRKGAFIMNNNAGKRKAWPLEDGATSKKPDIR